MYQPGLTFLLMFSNAVINRWLSGGRPVHYVEAFIMLELLH